MTIRKEPNPWQEDGESLDLTIKSYDSLERMHKHSTWTANEQEAFERGWQEAMYYYQSWFKKKFKQNNQIKRHHGNHP